MLGSYKALSDLVTDAPRYVDRLSVMADEHVARLEQWNQFRPVLRGRTVQHPVGTAHRKYKAFHTRYLNSKTDR